MAKLESEKEQSDSQQANNWWRRIYENLHNLGIFVAFSTRDIKHALQCAEGSDLIFSCHMCFVSSKIALLTHTV